MHGVEGCSALANFLSQNAYVKLDFHNSLLQNEFLDCWLLKAYQPYGSLVVLSTFGCFKTKEAEPFLV